MRIRNIYDINKHPPCCPFSFIFLKDDIKGEKKRKKKQHTHTRGN